MAVDPDNRNQIAGFVAVFSAAVLVAAVFEAYLIMSYLAAILIVGTLAVATIEEGNRELNIKPFVGIVGGLAASFLIGLTIIWATWNPESAATGTYVLGMPLPTAAYVIFIWFLPFLAPLYYAVGAFDRIVDSEHVESIVDDARDVQSSRDIPPPMATAVFDYEDVEQVETGGMTTDDAGGDSLVRPLFTRHRNPGR